MLLNIISGHDPMDGTSLEHPVPDYLKGLEGDLKGLKLGIPKEFFIEGLNPEVRTKVQEGIKTLESLGCETMEVSLPHTDYGIAAYYLIATAEASSNLARFDGVRYGRRAEGVKDLDDLYRRSRSEGFGDEVKRRILIGTYVLSAGYYDAYYLKAQKLRRLVSADYAAAFENVDVIMGPTTPDVAFRFGEKSGDPVSMYLCDIYTNGVNLAGLPGMSIPVGFADGLPVGLHIVGNYFAEARLLGVAHAYQRETDWHRRVPEGCA